jgi:hypothetical protein
MGGNPVIFAPSHRSYGDFILMSYICFHYKIEIPAIAAGMGMQMLVGLIMRAIVYTCATLSLSLSLSLTNTYLNVFSYQECRPLGCYAVWLL